MDHGMRRVGPARPQRGAGPGLRVSGLLLVAGVLSLACSPAPTTPPDFRVGVLALTDPRYEAASGRPTLEAVRMAAEEINQAGGVVVDGVPHTLRLIAVEHGDLVEEVSTQARRLINLDSIHVLLGPQLSRHAIPVAQIAQNSGVPFLTPMSSNPETTRGKPFAFRLAFLDDAQGGILARYAREELGLDRAGVLMDVTTPYSRDLAARFTSVFRELGGEPVEASFAGGGRQSPEEALRRLHAAGVEWVLAPIRSPDVRLVMELSHELELGLRFLGTDTWDVNALAPLPAAQGALVTHQWHWALPAASATGFVDRYRVRYDVMPRSTAALTYDALHLLALAATAAGSLEGAALRDALASLPPYQGASGIIHFRGTGDPARSVVVSTIRGGVVHFVRSVDPR